MAEPEIRESATRSSRRRSKRRPSSPVADLAKAFATLPRKVADRAMIGVAILIMIIGAYSFRQGQQFYPEIWLNSSASEVQYGFGTPQRKIKTGNDERWEYALDGKTHYAVLRDGQVVETGCIAGTRACRELFGFDTRADESVIWTRLGTPTGQQIVNGSKVLTYGDLGLTLEHRLFKVIRIAISSDAAAGKRSFAGAIGRFILLILP